MSKICVVCGKENPDDAEFCQECGASLNQEKFVDLPNSKMVDKKKDVVNRRVNSGKGLIYMGLFFILVGIIFYFYYYSKLQYVFGLILGWDSPGNIITIIIIIAGLFSIIRGYQIFSGETDKERKINKLNTVTWFLIIELPFLYVFTSSILPPNTSPYTILPIFYFSIFVLLLCIHNWKKNKYLGKNKKKKRRKR